MDFRDGKWVSKNTAEELIKLVGVIGGDGQFFPATWMKLPYCEGYERVALATTQPILMLGGSSTKTRPRPTTILPPGCWQGRTSAARWWGGTSASRVWRTRPRSRMLSCDRAFRGDPGRSDRLDDGPARSEDGFPEGHCPLKLEPSNPGNSWNPGALIYLLSDGLSRERMMKILIIGGTGQISRHISRFFLEAGAELTLFHRGKTRLPSLAGCDVILGDRNDFATLRAARWRRPGNSIASSIWSVLLQSRPKAWFGL